MKHIGLSEDEIIRYWSLHAEDLAFVKKFRKQYQLWVYLQVCSFKLLGQLLDNPNTLDTRIIGYACKSLTLDIIGTVEVPDRDATRTDYKKLIFPHLGFKPFNDSKETFYRWLELKVQAGMLIPEKLVSEAEAFLISNQISVPTPYYLKRHISSFCSQQHEKIFTDIYQQLPELLISEIDQILEVISGEGITWFQKFKEYPGASTISLLQDYLQRYHRIESIDLSDVDISFVPPELAQHLYQLMKYYDAFRVRRFKPAKRYSLMLLFLNESKKVSIDLVIEQFDEMVRVAASLKKKLSPAHEIIRRLSKGSPSDKLSKVFTQLGRILKTQYILQYITDSDLRDKVQRQLNKDEHRHQLARCIFFANKVSSSLVIMRKL